MSTYVEKSVGPISEVTVTAPNSESNLYPESPTESFAIFPFIGFRLLSFPATTGVYVFGGVR